jgi:valyl-tRNA synthetase
MLLYSSIDDTNMDYLPANIEFFFQVLPPPNVTGALHIGHALTVAIEVLSLISAYVYMPF